jgi:hypothetical protein
MEDVIEKNMDEIGNKIKKEQVNSTEQGNQVII